ncbi:MAG: 5-(carboxyamino)imidazole ribonucleotide synthase [Candidatus Baltobacteraceae bacterium]
MIQTIGVIGGGQLGRMFALDAKRMGYDVIVLDPQPRSPCGQVADEQIVAAYDDLLAIEDLGKRSDVVTYEFENIAIDSVRHLEANGFPVTPASSVLAITQNRLREKTFVCELGIPVAPFAPVQSERDAAQAAQNVGFPAVLKTVRGGYDGKGQWRLHDAVSVQRALQQAEGAPLIWERFVDFEREISVICTRNAKDEIVSYAPAENVHDRGILSMSIVPARASGQTQRLAQAHAAKIAQALQIVGTFCVEFFAMIDGTLLVNEIAPRPHNSGHYTMDATPCSQYEQHIRAICGLPPAQPQLLRNAIMVNILGAGTGDILQGTGDLLKYPALELHMYGKKHAVDRRKMGHFTMLFEGPVTEAEIAQAQAALALLRWSDAPSRR